MSSPIFLIKCPSNGTIEPIVRRIRGFIPFPRVFAQKGIYIYIYIYLHNMSPVLLVGINQ